MTSGGASNSSIGPSTAILKYVWTVHYFYDIIQLEMVVNIVLWGDLSHKYDKEPYLNYSSVFSNHSPCLRLRKNQI
jgi:hypothetical protein